MEHTLSGKAELRAYFKNMREDQDAQICEEIDTAIADRLFELDAYRSSRIVLTYVSFGKETDTHRIIEQAWADGKVVAVPRCIANTRTMQWHSLTGFDELTRGAYGIDEPSDDPATLLDIASLMKTQASSADLNTPQTPTHINDLSEDRVIALIPGLTFDTHGNRIGYGGGFYDTFLADFSGTSIGLCRKSQLCTDLCEYTAFDVFDRSVDIVVTETDIIDCFNCSTE